MSGLRRLMGLGFRTDPRRVAASIALSLVSGFALPIQALGVRLAVTGLQNGRLSSVVSAALLLGLGTAFIAAANVGNIRIARVLQHRVGHVLDRELIELVGAPQGIEHFERSDVADELALVRGQRDVLASPIAPVFQTISVAVGMAASLYLLFHIHPLLLLIPVCGLPALAGGVKAEVLHQSDLTRDASTQRRADTLINLATSRESAKELRTYNLADFVLSGFLQSQDVLLASERRSIRRQMLPILLGVLLTSLGYAASILFVTHLASVGRASAGDVYLTVFLSMAVLGQTVQLLLAVSSLVQLVSLARRLQWLTDTVTSTVTLPAADPVPTRVESAIALRNVSFRYPGTDQAVLSDVSLVLPAGSTIALVGENGAGKTTLVKLLAQLYQPDAGQILLDDRPLMDFDIEAWRASITAGFQDFCRFEFSAQHAVGVGELEAIDDHQAVRHALSRAGAGDLIDDLPMGLMTQLGRSFPKGVDLSGGQWQKVALGRALMRPVPLLMLLDEPTASLDAATESSLFDRFSDASRRLRETTGGITVLVSHRFTTVRMADLIVVLDAGRIRETGTHYELMTSGGQYAELFTIQSHSYGS